MATVIVMPRLSPTMEEGVLLKWVKKEGEKVSPGETIAEVETDKANMEFPLEDEGTLLKLLVAEGATVKLGAPVAVLGEPGEDIAAALAELAEGDRTGAKAEAEVSKPQTPAVETPPSATEAPKPQTAPVEKPPAATEAPKPQTPPVEKPPAATEAPKPQTPPQETPPAATEAPTSQAVAPAPAPLPEAGRLKASPLARKMAAEKGMDLRAVAGSGPGGRVVKRDVEAAPDVKAAPAPTSPIARAPSPVRAGAARPDETLPLSQMRKTIARRITEAKQTVPHFYLTMDASCDALWRFYEELKSAPRAPSEEEGKVSINDLIVKATAVGLTHVPAANASFSAEGLVRHGRIDIAMAVAIEDGLITPVVRDADQKSVGQIARETRDLIARAKVKKLRPEEYTGGTFSVSNLGMYGVREFAAIINPPESGILAVGALAKRPVVVEGEGGADRIEIRRQMTLTMSCDHRVVDGALGAQLLQAIVRVIEHPMALVL